MGYSIDVLNNIRANASPEYQERIPEATRDNIAQIGQAFTTYTLMYNEFCGALINKIGKTLIESKMFKNKLARFKGGAILTQQDVEEIFVQMAKAYGNYDPDGNDALDRHDPYENQVKVIYHRMNRQDKYAISIGDVDFVRVFKSEATLDNFITSLINSIYSGDSYDEWNAMKNVLATYGIDRTALATFKKTTDTSLVSGKTYYTRKGSTPPFQYEVVTNPTAGLIGSYYEWRTDAKTGYFDYEVPTMASASSKDEFAKAFVKAVRKAVQDTSFASTLYNSAGVMTWTNPEDMVLLVNKDVTTEVDVERLAQAFHSSDTDMKVVPTIITMDDFGIMGDTYGLLVDKEFLRVYDTLSRMEAQRNASGLFTNYFYHHWQILSASTFKNAVRFKAVATK